MANRKVGVDGLADAVMNELQEYAELAADDMKASVKKSFISNFHVQNRINCPLRNMDGLFFLLGYFGYQRALFR